jgi:hypothetical protein
MIYCTRVAIFKVILTRVSYIHTHILKHIYELSIVKHCYKLVHTQPQFDSYDDELVHNKFTTEDRYSILYDLNKICRSICIATRSHGADLMSVYGNMHNLEIRKSDLNSCY